jgi:methylmalonyl-CoA/ethylmalonyl-CoA epimerase
MSDATTRSTTHGALDAKAGATDLGGAPLGQIALRVHDGARAERFYRDVLGMRHLFSLPPKMTFFDCAGVRLMLSQPESVEDDHPGSIFYFRVDDIRATHATLAARGAPMIDEPHLIARMPDHELWMTFVRDPDGNVLGIMSEVRP